VVSAFPGSDPEWVARRASSFGAGAAAYAEQRPGYPEAAVRWALAGAPGGHVLDLAAGTGKLTGLLVAQADELVAVEPDPGMLAELRRRLPGVDARQGSAEDIPLADASVDAILAGQAMHWFDQERSLPELARVLAPGGVLAGLWNLDDDRVPWLAGLKELTGNTSSYLKWRLVPLLAGGRYFTPPERAEFPNSQRRTTESMIATVLTNSQVLVLPESERTALAAGVRDYLDRTPETAGGEFDRPMITVVIRATKR
jgi:ubiquinone/menaquinone biosynthesis C-methylase UbiE